MEVAFARRLAPGATPRLNPQRRLNDDTHVAAIVTLSAIRPKRAAPVKAIEL
jgi:hypothetical protein